MKLKLVYRNLSLKNKMLLWFVIISLIAAVPVGVFSFISSTHREVEKTIREKEIVLNIVVEDMYKLLHEIEHSTIIIANNQNIQRILTEKEKTSNSKTSYQMRKALYKLSTSVNISLTTIFSNGSIFTNANDDYIVKETQKQFEGINDRLMGQPQGLWGVPIIKEQREIVLPHFRRIKEYERNTILGIVAVGLNNSEVSQKYSSYISEGESFVITNSDGVILSSNNIGWIGKDFFQIFTINKSKKSGHHYCYGNLQSVSSLAVTKEDYRKDLIYYSITPTSVVMLAPNSIIAVTIFVTLLAIIVSILVAFLVSSTIAKPLTKLVNTMNNAKTADIPLSFNPLYQDEIGVLADSYNHMAKRLKKSMQAVLEEERKRRLAEYNALKLQINPHFLYNTLSSIAWLAQKGYNAQVVDMTRALSTIFRIGISKDGDLIKISDEVAHVESYLEIQQIRFQESFKYILDIHPDVMNLYTVKIVLQPLVENAIEHGVRKSGRPGLVKISAFMDNEYVYLNVMDNGCTISEEELRDLNLQINSDNVKDYPYGIGARNVNTRLKYYFSGKSGLSYYIENGFTVARIKLPIVANPKSVEP